MSHQSTTPQRNQMEEDGKEPSEEHEGQLTRKFAQLGMCECMDIMMQTAEKPCVTSVAGHAACGNILASKMNFGVPELLKKEKMTHLANGVVINPKKTSMDSYTGLMETFALSQGSLITSADLGMIVSTGCGGHLIEVYRRIEPVVLSFGDNIGNPWESEQELEGKGNEPDYLRPQLMEFLKESGYHPIDGGVLNHQYNSVVEGLIHGFLYTNVAIICCYSFSSNLPGLIDILIKEFHFEIKFQSVENIDVVFAHAVVHDTPRYVFILSDEAKAAKIATILLVLPLLNVMSGSVQSNSIKTEVPFDLPLQKTPSYLFGNIRLCLPKDKQGGLKLMDIEGKSTPIPRDSNVLLQLPSSIDSGHGFLRKGEQVDCILFAPCF